MSDTFELTEDLVKLLRASYVSRGLSYDEYGAAEIDPKRPYGNSDVPRDIAEILGWTEYNFDDDNFSEGLKIAELLARARKIHEQTPTALQVVLASGSFEPGTYKRTAFYRNDWKLVK